MQDVLSSGEASTEAELPDFTMATAEAETDETRVQRLHLGPTGEEEAAPASSGKIGKDAFADLFVGAFELPQLIKGPAYAPLAVPEERKPAGLTTGGVLFDLLERHAPFLIPPDTGISAELMVALGFCRTQWAIYVDIRGAERAAAARAAEARKTDGLGPMADH